MSSRSGSSFSLTIVCAWPDRIQNQPVKKLKVFCFDQKEINKNNRKDINKIELDFVYNFNKNKFRFDNVKIDNISNEKLDSFIDSHNFSGKTFDNKIMLKNFINNFFISYSG